jgi:hypothetical protein
MSSKVMVPGNPSNPETHGFLQGEVNKMARKQAKKTSSSVAKSLLSGSIRLLRKGYMAGCHVLLPFHEKRVVFRSFMGKAYSDNPKAVSEQLHQFDPSYEIVWLFNDPASKSEMVPDYVTCLKMAQRNPCG